MTTLPSPTGWIAIFKPYREEPVVGWDEHGCAQIVDSSSGRRLRIDELPGHDFCDLERAEPAFITALPADGWQAVFADEEGRAQHVPLLAWFFTSTGQTKPVIADADGSAIDPRELGNFVQVWHPSNPISSPAPLVPARLKESN
ncbi:hypothetical protein R1T08_24265 [Streptomyces sp. SBC-4]|nr:hypothetical protein [Streptomyces sp. SBC-4]MDV5147205.1 hypothetical protein [Streptomyces sp. SBC-4]